MNFHNEITKLQERVAALETSAGDPDAKLPKHLEPAAEGYVETGAAKAAPESKPGTNIQKGPVLVDKAEPEPEAQGSGTEKYGDAGTWTESKGAGLTDDTSKAEPETAA